MTNISRNANPHIDAPVPRFWVMATQSIQGRKRTIEPGDHVLIDPNMKPEAGQLVLVGNNLMPWEGQGHVRGCATGSFANEGVAVQVCSVFA